MNGAFRIPQAGKLSGDDGPAPDVRGAQGLEFDGVAIVSDVTKPTDAERRSMRRDELMTFLLLTVVLAPGAAVAFVGAYGLVVWLYQLIAGPPGPPVG